MLQVLEQDYIQTHDTGMELNSISQAGVKFNRTQGNLVL